MNVPTRLAAFGLVLAVALAAGAGLGSATDPVGRSRSTPPHAHQEDTMSTTSHTPVHGAHEGAAADPQAGYALAVGTTVLAPGPARSLTFRVLGPDGRAVTRFEDRHERPLHLILVGNDLGTYAHLHPALGADGTWRVELPALGSGGYRLVADTAPAGGPDLVLTEDLLVPGPAASAPLPDPAASVAVDDLHVSLAAEPSDHGLTARLAVQRDGREVEPEPYLGARGHLVAIAADDLAYLHVHPTDEDPRGGVGFAIDGAAPGRYRLFFDFSVDGRVRTAAFTLDIPEDQP